MLGQMHAVCELMRGQRRSNSVPNYNVFEETHLEKKEQTAQYKIFVIQ
jgi:hypothetical protein